MHIVKFCSEFINDIYKNIVCGLQLPKSEHFIPNSNHELKKKKLFKEYHKAYYKRNLKFYILYSERTLV